MTDLSSKGLLPQLVDVLRSLADSQELLRQRIRSASLEHIRAYSSGVAAMHQPLPGPAPREPVLVPTIPIPIPTPTPTLVDDARDGHSVDSGEVAREPQRRERAESTWPPGGTRTQRAARERTSPGAVSDELTNRDYNFFDELDTRLATLLRPEVADEN